MNIPWTPDQLTLLNDLSLSNAEVAKRTGRSEAAIRGKRQRASVKSPPVAPRKLPPPPAPTTYEEDKNRAGEGYWKRQYQEQRAKYEKALTENSAVEQLVAMAADLAPVSYQLSPVHCELFKRHGGGPGSPQSALLLLSDTHVGQKIPADQTLGYGGYDFATFLSRLKYTERGVTSITQDHTTTKLDELVVCLGGDMIHGALNHGSEASQHSTLFEQFYGAGHALAQFLRNLAHRFPKIRVYCTVGNHPRWQNQHKMPTENRFSNLDCFLYSYIEALTRDIPTIEWDLNKQPFALFDVQGFKFHLSHGDHLKGGDKALGIPNHAVGRMVSSTSQLFGKAQEASPHYFLVGHLHRSIVLPHARGSFIVNGGFPGLDGYGLAGGFSPVDPTQTFFLVHPKFGKTATYDIQLKYAKVGDCAPYDLPQNFLPS